MSIEHKAYIFNYTAFSKELEPILKQALISGKTDLLKNFISTNKSDLKDPYEGESLNDDWEDMIEDKDPHQYGDFAITKYYSPVNEYGLGYDWEEIKNTVDSSYEDKYSPLLGIPLGFEGEYFDPGKTGSYFQSAEQVARSLNILKNVTIEDQEFIGILKEFKRLLEKALLEKKGIYVTF